MPFGVFLAYTIFFLLSNQLYYDILYYKIEEVKEKVERKEKKKKTSNRFD